MRYYTTEEAVNYIKERYGISYSASTFAKYRCQCTGPAWTRLNGKILYREDHLDHFVGSARVINQMANQGVEMG